METLLLVGSMANFYVHRHFGAEPSLRLFWCIVGAVRAIPSLFESLRSNLKANETFYAFIAAIIAGMPIRFMTRVIL